MEKNISKEDLVQIRDFTKEAFFNVGYNPDDNGRVMALTKAIAKTWKKEIPKWDINDLQDKIINLSLSGELDKFVGNTVIPKLRQMYRTQFPKRAVYQDLTFDREQSEREFLRQIVNMVNGKSHVEPGTSWRELSLFHLVIERCRKMISGDLIKRFVNLRNYLKTHKNPLDEVNITTSQLFGEKKAIVKSPEEKEIVGVANLILDELSKNAHEVCSLLLDRSTPTPPL